MFVASSSERIAIAIEVAKKLNAAGKAPGEATSAIRARPWTNDIFSFSRTYIESLERELDQADFAVVIYMGDDLAQMRTQRVNLPRDNVVFELGLFIGRLSRERCFFFVDAASDTHITSDLSGVKEVSFISGGSGPSGSHQRSLGQACRRVVDQMRELGERFKPDPGIRVRQQEAWQFIRAAAGYWWSLQHWEREGIGFVVLAPDPLGPTMTVRGDVFAPAAPARPTASWGSTSSVLVRDGAEWILQFTWAGTASGGEEFKGSSRYVLFANERGKGEIIEADTARKRSDRKESGLKRCSREEVAIMLGTDNLAKRELIARQIAQWVGA